MVSLRILSLSLLISMPLFAAASIQPQESPRTSSRAATPSPTPRDDQEPVRVFTEEVRLPVIARDEYGHFDPTLGLHDLIVFEDGVQQQIKSVTRIPASVLLLLGAGGEMNPAIRIGTTRATAGRVVSSLRDGDQVAVLQFSKSVETLQSWTQDLNQVSHVLKTKLHSGNGSRLIDAINAAAAYFDSQPIGNRHLVLISDGVEMPHARASYEEAMKVLAASDQAQGKAEWDAAVKRLMVAQTSVHVISYTELGRLALKGKDKKYHGSNSPPGSVRASGIEKVGMDPTLPPGMSRGGSDPAYGDGMNLDPKMKRLRKAYEKAMNKSEQRLASLAEETGALLLKPKTADEMVTEGALVAREIGSQYVVTYVPKRPLAEAKPGEYRRVQVAPRRSGLEVRSRRGYLATP